MGRFRIKGDLKNDLEDVDSTDRASSALELASSVLRSSAIVWSIIGTPAPDRDVTIFSLVVLYPAPAAAGVEAAPLGSDASSS